jgi:hypothetical protein
MLNKSWAPQMGGPPIRDLLFNTTNVHEILSIATSPSVNRIIFTPSKKHPQRIISFMKLKDNINAQGIK